VGRVLVCGPHGGKPSRRVSAAVRDGAGGVGSAEARERRCGDGQCGARAGLPRGVRSVAACARIGDGRGDGRVDWCKRCARVGAVRVLDGLPRVRAVRKTYTIVEARMAYRMIV
jgi:hypothetical protein